MPGTSDQPWADQNVTTGTVTWQLADAQGTIRDTIDSSSTGSLSSVRHVKFDSYGNVAGTTQPLRFGYTGHQQDAASGLVYMNARYYDPATGQFISQDPTSFSGGDTNLYRYVGNNTPNLIDPMGLSAVATRRAVIHPQWDGSALTGFLDGLLTTGGSLVRSIGIGSLGLDLGWINASISAQGNDNSADIGIFGPELELDYNTRNHQLNSNIGAHIGFGIGAGASIGATYIDDTASVGVTYGVASTSLSLNHGRLSEGLNIGLVGPPAGQDGVSVGYGLSFGSDGNFRGSFNANISATNFANDQLGMGDINSAYNGYQQVVGSGFGLFDGGKAIQNVFGDGQPSNSMNGGTAYQPNLRGSNQSSTSLPPRIRFLIWAILGLCDQSKILLSGMRRTTLLLFHPEAIRCLETNGRPTTGCQLEVTTQDSTMETFTKMQQHLIAL